MCFACEDVDGSSVERLKPEFLHQVTAGEDSTSRLGADRHTLSVKLRLWSKLEDVYQARKITRVTNSDGASQCPAVSYSLIPCRVVVADVSVIYLFMAV